MWVPFLYIFLLMGNFFYHVGVFFSPCGGLWLRFHPYWDLFFYHVGRQSYHVGDFLLRFSFYWELVSPCGGIFATFFFIWGAFCTYGGRPFLYIWGAFWAPPPPRTNIPARPCVLIAIPHHTGASPGFGWGGGQEFFFQIWKFACREATCCAWLRHAQC